MNDNIDKICLTAHQESCSVSRNKRDFANITQKQTLTNISLVSHLWDIGKQCKPRSDAAFWVQGLHCLLTGICIRNRIKMKNVHQTPLKLEMDSSN